MPTDSQCLSHLRAYGDVRERKVACCTFIIQRVRDRGKNVMPTASKGDCRKPSCRGSQHHDVRGVPHMYLKAVRAERFPGRGPARSAAGRLLGEGSGGRRGSRDGWEKGREEWEIRTGGRMGWWRARKDGGEEDGERDRWRGRERKRETERERMGDGGEGG